MEGWELEAFTPHFRYDYPVKGNGDGGSTPYSPYHAQTSENAQDSPGKKNGDGFGRPAQLECPGAEPGDYAFSPDGLGEQNPGGR